MCSLKQSEVLSLIHCNDASVPLWCVNAHMWNSKTTQKCSSSGGEHWNCNRCDFLCPFQSFLMNTCHYSSGSNQSSGFGRYAALVISVMWKLKNWNYKRTESAASISHILTGFVPLQLQTGDFSFALKHWSRPGPHDILNTLSKMKN